MKEKVEFTVLPSKYANGPKGLGDPNDTSLRKVEIDVCIPKLIRDRTRTEKCVPEVKEFNQCCLDNGVTLVLKCRRENERMKACMEKWFHNEDFIKECTEQYIRERNEYRRTGIPKKQETSRIKS